MNTGEIIDKEDGQIFIRCIRYYKCYHCIKYEEKQRIEKDRLDKLENERLIKERIEREKLEEKKRIEREKLEEEKKIERIKIEKKEKKRLEKDKERFNEQIETSNMYKEDERTILEDKEFERRRKEDLQNEELKTKCKCGIQLIDLCNCKIPKFELNKLNNKYICKNNNCKKWKCRCIVTTNNI